MNLAALKYLSLICLLLVLNISCSSTSTDSNTNSGEIQRIELSNGMILDVFTPANYSASQSYPLLLLNDGEIMFGSSNLRMDDIIQVLIDQGEIEPIIAVAIHESGNRNDWYIPYDDQWITDNWGDYEPAADFYAETILETIIPRIEAEFNIDKEEVGILGVSLGGLVSTWMGLQYPDEIKYSAGLSGSLWAGDYEIFNDVDQTYDRGQKFWFDIGTAEWNYYVPLYEALDSAGLEPGVQSFYLEVPDGGHNRVSWLARIHQPLKVFYGLEQEIEPLRMEVVLECIPSVVTPGLNFRRMNPIITLSNDVIFSLAHAADYSLLSGSAQLGNDGSFINDPSSASRVLIEYKEFSQSLILPQGWCL